MRRTKKEKTRVTTMLANALFKSMNEEDNELGAYDNAIKACMGVGGWTPRELRSLPVCDTLFKPRIVKTYKI